jgi:hypothetical protein
MNVKINKVVLVKMTLEQETKLTHYVVCLYLRNLNFLYVDKFANTLQTGRRGAHRTLKPICLCLRWQKSRNADSHSADKHIFYIY